MKGSLISDGRIDVLTQLLATGLSHKRIRREHGIDHTNVPQYFDSRIKVSPKYVEKVCKAVRTRKLTYDQVKEEFGKRGLQALNNYSVTLKEVKMAEQRKQIVKMRLSEDLPVSYGRIQRALKVGPDAIWDALREKGLDTKDNHIFKRAAAKKALFKKLYDEGIRDKDELARLTGYALASVTQVAAAMHLSFAPTPKYSVRDMEMVTELKKTMTWGQMADVFKASPASLKAFYYSYVQGGHANANKD